MIKLDKLLVINNFIKDSWDQYTKGDCIVSVHDELILISYSDYAVYYNISNYMDMVIDKRFSKLFRNSKIENL